jgi:CHAD domain-containing protein
MAYKFGEDESVRHAIRRCSREQLDRAALELSEGVNTGPVSAIHAARKAIKKERSLLRLARGAMPREQRRRENAALREAGRCLSGVRDSDVLIASVDQLSKRFSGQLPAATFRKVRGQLETRRSAKRRNGSVSVVDPQALQELTAIGARMDDWQLRTGGWKALETGLVRSYTRGRGAFARAASRGEMEDLHAWRKRVKDLWYHDRLLAPTCGPTVRGQAKDLDRLSDLLGDDHDLALLRRKLTHDNTSIAVDIEAVLNLIDHRRTELQTEAIHLGHRLYAETPKAFRRRMRASWKAGRALTRAPHQEQPGQLAAATR